MLRAQTCHYCHGSGKAESLEERTVNGDWTPNTILAHDIADAWIKADPGCPLRWIDCQCPICGGDGSYVLEFTPAKIF